MGPTPESGASLADEHHVLRYVRPRFLDKGTVDGAAFLARKDKDLDGLSVNWLEWFPGLLEDQVAAARRAARLEYGRTGGLARLNVGQSKSFVRENHPEGLTLSLVHDPLPAEEEHEEDPSHSLIKGAPFQNGPEADLFADLITHCVLAPIFPAVVRA